MGAINQSRVKSGFDVEALLGAPYLRMVLQTAYDAGVSPSSAEFGGAKLALAMLESRRLYEPAPDANGNLPPGHPQAFETEILFNHPLGANLRVRTQIRPENNFPFFFDLFVRIDLEKTQEEGTISTAGINLAVVDIESPALPILADPPFNMPKSEVLARVKEILERGTYWASEGSVNVTFHRERFLTSLWAARGSIPPLMKGQSKPPSSWLSRIPTPMWRFRKRRG